MHLPATLLALLSLCQDDGSEFLKFKAGTQWVYLMSDGSSQTRTVMKVVGEKDGKLLFESKDYQGEEKEPLKTESLYMAIQNGVLTFGEIAEEGETTPHFAPLKIGSKKGDKWKSPMMGGEVDVEHLGTEDITTCAKTPNEIAHKGAIHTQFKMSMGEGMDRRETVGDFYFAKGYGLVKITFKSGDDQVMNFEMKEFTAAK